MLRWLLTSHRRNLAHLLDARQERGSIVRALGFAASHEALLLALVTLVALKGSSGYVLDGSREG